MSRPIPLSLLLLVASLCALSACRHDDPVAAEDAPHVSTSHPVRRDIALTRRYVCQIHSSRHIELRALERGYLHVVSVSEGQVVSKGQPMFSLLPVTYQAELGRAQAEAEAARIELENTRRLAADKVVAPTELALAEARYEKAAAAVTLAQAHLDFTRIDAPFDGIMDRLHVREGSLVEEGELLTTLSDNAHMWVYFNVPEAEYLDLVTADERPEHKTVKLLMANDRLFAQPGRIAVIEADFNNETGTIPFRADFPNPARLLRHGQTGTILLERPLPGALVIPQKATFEILDHHYVFVVGPDDKVVQRRIEVGAELEDVFVVTRGLEEKDRIVVEGLRQVHDGQAVVAAAIAPDDLLAGLKTASE